MTTVVAKPPALLLSTTATFLVALSAAPIIVLDHIAATHTRSRCSLSREPKYVSCLNTSHIRLPNASLCCNTTVLRCAICRTSCFILIISTDVLVGCQPIRAASFTHRPSCSYADTFPNIITVQGMFCVNLASRARHRASSLYATVAEKLGSSGDIGISSSPIPKRPCSIDDPPPAR